MKYLSSTYLIYLFIFVVFMPSIYAEESKNTPLDIQEMAEQLSHYDEVKFRALIQIINEKTHQKWFLWKESEESHQDFKALVKKWLSKDPNFEEAFGKFRRKYPDDPRIEVMMDLIKIQKAQGVSERGDGNIEFITTLTFYGLGTGLAWGIWAQFEEYIIPLTALTTAGAFIGSLYYTQHREIAVPDATLLENGSLWGLFNGIGTLALIDEDVFEDYGSIFLWGTSTLGMAGAFAIGRSMHPSAGSVALANSGMIWGAFTGLMTAMALDTSGRNTMILSMIGMNVGTASMAMLASKVKTSRTRQGLIDLGGGLGLLSSAALITMMHADFVENQTLYALMLWGGAALGVGIASYLTSDDERNEQSASIEWGAPMPYVVPDPLHPREMQKGIYLFNGRF